MKMIYPNRVGRSHVHLPALIVWTVFVAQCGLYGHTDAKSSTASASNDYETVKTALDQYGYADDMDDRLRNVKAALVAKGPTIIPSLVRLFRESENDHYRTAVINTMFSISGEKSQVVHFVESELAQDPSEWDGKRWIFSSLVRLHDIDPPAAAQLASRVLRLDERLTQMCALGILKKSGSSEELVPLESFLVERRRNTPADGQLDGVAIFAEEAIGAIKMRMQPQPKRHIAGTKEAAPRRSAQPGLQSGSVQTQQVQTGLQTGAEATRAVPRWLWGIGAALLATVFFLLKKGGK